VAEVRVSRDICGAPIAQLPSGVFIHIYPFTCYHLERFIWTTAPEGYDVDALIPFRERPTPSDLDPSTARAIWAKGLAFPQAVEIAAWLGGRLPSKREWREAATSVWPNAARLAVQAPVADGADSRLVVAMEVLASGGHPREQLLPEGFGVFATGFSREPYAELLVLRTEGDATYLRADGAIQKPQNGFGMCCVFEPA
jgi:hypothetical protein